MDITDKYVVKQLEMVNSYDLDEMIESYPEEERNGKSDIQILADEASWVLYGMYLGDGTASNDEYERARLIFRYKNDPFRAFEELRMLPTARDVRQAKELMNEVNRLKSLIRRLNGKEVYGRWQR